MPTPRTVAMTSDCATRLRCWTEANAISSKRSPTNSHMRVLTPSVAYLSVSFGRVSAMSPCATRASAGHSTVSIRSRTVHPSAGGRDETVRSGGGRRRAGGRPMGRRVRAVVPSSGRARSELGRTARARRRGPDLGSAAGGVCRVRGGVSAQDGRPEHLEGARDAVLLPGSGGELGCARPCGGGGRELAHPGGEGGDGETVERQRCGAEALLVDAATPVGLVGDVRHGGLRDTGEEGGVGGAGAAVVDDAGDPAEQP